MRLALKLTKIAAGFLVFLLAVVVMALGLLTGGLWLLMGWLGAILFDRLTLSEGELPIHFSVLFSRPFFYNTGMVGALKLAEALMILCLVLSGLAGEEELNLKGQKKLPAPE
jgi:hypothetical protein